MCKVHFPPKKLFETALKRIDSYMKETRDKGFILNPSSDVLKLDFYPEAYFSGMYWHEIPTNTDCVNIRTGLVITFVEFSCLLGIKVAD